MAYKIANRVKMSVTGTPAQGSIELATAVSGFQSFSAAGVVNGDVVPYVLEDGLAWELGLGTISVAGSAWTLQRTTVTQSSAGGTTKLNASAATIVMLAPLAADLQSGIADGNLARFGTNGRLGVNVTSPTVSVDIDGTDAVRLPVGTTAQRPSGTTGYIRYNTTTGSFEGYNGSVWGSIGGGAAGGSTDQIFYLNGQEVTTNYTIPVGQNAGTFGPVTVNSSAIVTISAGSTWTIV
jgi:hypothetical protein